MRADERAKAGLWNLLGLWFGLHLPVSRAAYVATGFGLCVFKYVGEALAIWMGTGRSYSVWAFLSPILSVRTQVLQGAAPELGWGLVICAIPFLWIAISMSIRRAIMAGLSPWWGFLVLVPFVNFAVMLLLAILPDVNRELVWYDEIPRHQAEQLASRERWRIVALAVMCGLFVQVGLMLLAVYGFNSYGWMLFVASPILAGAVTSSLCQRPYYTNLTTSLSAVLLMQLAFAAGLLLFALEGVICVAMAVPLVVPLGVIGGLLGYLTATVTPTAASADDDWRSGAVCIALLPLGIWLETLTAEPPLVPVSTRIEINAPPEVVWKTVLAFPALEPAQEWYFRAGIACPMSAYIEGSGPGAVRHCVFTTGEFVEPITVWDAPRRLAFQVADQPEPMFELTPYHSIHPPHLQGTLRSEQGEFLLIPRADGGTTLQGSTWYRLHMQPLDYWGPLSEAIIHRIHLRVLRHVQHCAEQAASTTLQ